MKSPAEAVANPSKLPYLPDLSNPRDVFLSDLERLIESHKIHWVRSGLPFMESEHIPCYSGEYNGLRFLLYYVVRNFKLQPVLEVGVGGIKVEGEPVQRISELVVSSFGKGFSASLISSEKQMWIDLCGKLSR